MTYNITKANGTSVSVPNNEIDEKTCYDIAGGDAVPPTGLGVKLVGKNAVGFGQAFAQNFLQLVENFSSNKTPSDTSTLQGQLWFKRTDDTNGNLYVRKSNSGTTGGIDNWKKLLTSDELPSYNPPANPITSILGVSGSFVLNALSPNMKVTFANAATNGWNEDTIASGGRCRIDVEFTSHGFFTDQPNGSVFVGSRMDLEVIETNLRGQGAWIGNIGSNAYYPSAGIISWYGSGDPSSKIYSNTGSAQNLILEDNVKYKLVLETTKIATISAGKYDRYIRYRIYKYVPAVVASLGVDPVAEAWELNIDSGDVLDLNSVVGSNSGIVFGYILPSAPVSTDTWSVQFDRAYVTWSQSINAFPDITSKLSKFGDTFDGDLTLNGKIDLNGNLLLSGNARRILLDSTNATISNRGGFQSSTLNTETSVMAIPNGASQSSNFFAVNRSNTTTYGAVKFGMEGNNAAIRTSHVGSTAPPLYVYVGSSEIIMVSATAVTVTGDAIVTGDIAGATVTVSTNLSTPLISITGSSKSIGDDITTLPLITNIGGVEALSIADNAYDMEVYSSVAGLNARLNATTYTRSEVVALLQPLYGIMSVLLAELTNKKII